MNFAQEYDRYGNAYDRKYDRHSCVDDARGGGTKGCQNGVAENYRRLPLSVVLQCSKDSNPYVGFKFTLKVTLVHRLQNNGTWTRSSNWTNSYSLNLRSLTIPSVAADQRGAFVLTEGQLHRVICNSTQDCKAKILVSSGIGRPDVKFWMTSYKSREYIIAEETNRPNTMRGWLQRANGGQMALHLDKLGKATRVFVSTNFGKLLSVDPFTGKVTDLVTFSRQVDTKSGAPTSYGPGLALQSYMIPKGEGGSADSEQVRLYITLAGITNFVGASSFTGNENGAQIWRINVNTLDAIYKIKTETIEAYVEEVNKPGGGGRTQWARFSKFIAVTRISNPIACLIVIIHVPLEVVVF